MDRGSDRWDLAVRQHPLHFGEARGCPGEQFTGLGSEADMTAIRLDELLARRCSSWAMRLLTAD
jgi:hypothetical protein